MSPEPRPIQDASLFAVLAALAAAAVFIAVSAMPAGAAEARKLAVAYDDLDLSNPADLVILERRVTAAARAVCRRPDASSEAVGDIRSCVADTIARAQASVESVIARGSSASVSIPARAGSVIAPIAR